MTESRSDLASLISERRKAESMTQADLADKVGVSTGLVSLWETARRDPTEYLPKLEEVLGNLRDQNEDITNADQISDFGIWLETTRKNKNLSIQELAGKANLSFMTIQNIERGKIINPQKKTIEKLETALGEQYNDNSEEQNELEDQNDDRNALGSFIDFNPLDENDWPDFKGIYVFYDISSRPIYVGQGDIKKRLKDHKDKFWFRSPIVQYASYVKVDDKDLRRQIEEILIRFMKNHAIVNKQNVER